MDQGLEVGDLQVGLGLRRHSNTLRKPESIPFRHSGTYAVPGGQGVRRSVCGAEDQDRQDAFSERYRLVGRAPLVGGITGLARHHGGDKLARAGSDAAEPFEPHVVREPSASRSPADEREVEAFLDDVLARQLESYDIPGATRLGGEGWRDLICERLR